MDLFLLRHGIAVDRGTPGFSRDSDRPLTPAGEAAMKKNARGMLALGLRFDFILSSPYPRARQTAEIVAAILGGSVEFSDQLAVEGDARKLISELRSRPSGGESVLLVGHEPYLSGLISLLLTGTLAVNTTLKKGGLCKLAVADLHAGPCASLEWLLTPKQLRLFS